MPISHALLALLVLLTLPEKTRAEPDRVLVMAHRGGLGLWPENTLLAFRNAAGAGADVIETDIWQTRDGIIVAHHDGTVDRTTDGEGHIGDLALEEIKRLDAGYRWSGDGPYPYRGPGLEIPPLAEVLDALPDATFNIDIKDHQPGIVDALCDLLQAKASEDRVIVGSFEADITRAFRRRCPDVRTAATSREASRFLLYSKLHLDWISGLNTHALQVPRRIGPIKVVTPRFVAAAHRRGIQVHVWTINDPQEMIELTEMGVDGMFTDYPDRLMAIQKGE